jgi:hypothetical protein
VPATPAQAAPQSAAGKPADSGKAPQKAGSAFRETLWFKQGDVEQMVADAKSKMQAAGKPPSEAAVLPDDARPLEDRYADDGSVTVEDRKKFSLRTGGTATALPVAGPEVPGEKMDEDEMVGEISGTRRTMILVIAAVVILALVVVIAMMVKGRGKGSASGLGATSSGELAAAAPAPVFPAAGGAPVLAGHASYDAGMPPGATGGPGPGSPPGKTAALGLGAAVGATNPGVGGVTGEAKSALAKKAAVKKKPAPKKPVPKKKR